MSGRAQGAARVRTLAIFAVLLLPLAGCDRSAEAAVSAQYMEALAEAAPDSASVPVSERLWTWEIGTDISGGDPSPAGRLVSLVDWDTGDLGVWEAATGSTRHITHKEGWAPDESYAWSSTFSPDGAWVAFGYDVMDEERRVFPELRVVDADGSEEPRVLVRMPEREWMTPTDWGEPGILATVEGPADSIFRIMVVDPVDGDTRTVLESTARMERPVFSPDGRTIAFEQEEEIQLVRTRGGVARTSGIEGGRIIGWPRDGEGLYFYDREGDIRTVEVRGQQTVGQPRLVRRDGVGWGIGASDDALFTSVPVDARRVYVVDIDGDGRMQGEPRPVTPLPRGRTERLTDGRSSYPALSPDGRTLAYIQGRRRIEVSTPDGRRIRELPVTGETLWDLQWAPDGKALWYRLARPGGSVIQRYDLGTGHAVDVMEHRGNWTLDPIRPVVYERVQVWNGGQSAIWAYNYETNERRLVVELPTEPTIGWVSVSADGSRLAYFASDESGSACRLMVVPAEGGTPREIHRVPGDWFASNMTYWSAGGTRILYVKGPDDPEAEGPWTLMSVPVEGGEPTAVAEFGGFPGYGLNLNFAAGRMAFEAGWDRFELWKTEVGGGR